MNYRVVRQESKVRGVCVCCGGRDKKGEEGGETK